MKASIDAGISKKTILRKYKDPHLFTSVIKYFLRELPDPLLSSAHAHEWKEVDLIKDDIKRIKAIKELLEKIPKDNKNNIAFLLHFLAKLVEEEFYNKMSIENIIVVLSPNLLWDSNRVHVPIDNVYKCMIEHVELILEHPEGENINTYNFIRNTSSITDIEGDDYLSETGDNLSELMPTVTERNLTIDPISIERRNTVKRSAIKENRRQYQDRSFSGEMRIPARKSMENLEITDNIMDEEEDNTPEVITRKVVRKTSKSYDEDAHKSILPFVRTYSISSKPPNTTMEARDSSSEPILHQKSAVSKSVDNSGESSPATTPSLKRSNTVSQAVMSRIPKMSFSMPKRNVKSVDPKIAR